MDIFVGILLHLILSDIIHLYQLVVTNGRLSFEIVDDWKGKGDEGVL